MKPNKNRVRSPVGSNCFKSQMIALFVEIYESDATAGYAYVPVYLIAVRQSLKYSNTTSEYLNTILEYLARH
ncbi:hypothetical protein [Nostoc sp.]